MTCREVLCALSFSEEGKVKEMQKPEDDLWKQVWAESVSTQDKESSVRLVSYSRNEWSKDMPRDEV